MDELIRVLVVSTVTFSWGCDAAKKDDTITAPPPTAAATVSTRAPAGARGHSSGVPTQRGELPDDDLPRGGSPAEQPIPEGALTLPNLQNCIAECVDRNRMRAVPAQQIDDDCKAECNKGCLAHCDAGSEAAKHACRKDCEAQSKAAR